MSAAEPIRESTVRTFYEAFDAACLPDTCYPAYGLAEHTVSVSMGGLRILRLNKRALEVGLVVPMIEDTEAPAMSLVGCGRITKPDARVRIVDPETHRPCQPGEIGEIWCTATKALGYIGLETETKETFRALVDDGDTTEYLRTGDLGFFHDDELFVAGRHKDLIIVHGRDLYPQDLEDSLRDAHPLIRPGGLAGFLGQRRRLRRRERPGTGGAVRRVLYGQGQRCAGEGDRERGAPATTGHHQVAQPDRGARQSGTGQQDNQRQGANGGSAVSTISASGPRRRQGHPGLRRAAVGTRGGMMADRRPAGIELADGPDDPRLYRIDDTFRDVLAKLSFITKMSRVGKTRFFHPKASTAAGTLTVLDSLTFPGHEFFRPGRRFEVIARYGNATVTDDIAPDIRGVTLRLFEPGTDSLHDGLFDLTLNTGECFFPHTAEVFARYSGGPAARDSVFDDEPHLYPAMWDVIRRAVSYADYDYYSQAPRGFMAQDGRAWLVRFRLRSTTPAADQGQYDPGELRYPPDPPELLPRDPHDRRAPDHLHDELRTRVVGSGVEGVLQLQLHPLTDSAADDETALDSSLPWPEVSCPWHDVALLRLDTMVDNGLIEGLSFNTGHAPPSLGVALSRSPSDNASTNHLRVLMYRMAAAARRGEPMPADLADLLTTGAAPATPVATAAVTTTRDAMAEHGSGPRTVCVVGAGPAGLTAARELERAGHRAIVLEARADVGGKCDSIEIDGHAYDLGGHLCTTQYERLAQLVVELVYVHGGHHQTSGLRPGKWSVGAAVRRVLPARDLSALSPAAGR